MEKTIAARSMEKLSELSGTKPHGEDQKTQQDSIHIGNEFVSNSLAQFLAQAEETFEITEASLRPHLKSPDGNIPRSAEESGESTPKLVEDDQDLALKQYLLAHFAGKERDVLSPHGDLMVTQTANNPAAEATSKQAKRMMFSKENQTTLEVEAGNPLDVLGQENIIDGKKDEREVTTTGQQSAAALETGMIAAAEEEASRKRAQAEAAAEEDRKRTLEQELEAHPYQAFGNDTMHSSSLSPPIPIVVDTLTAVELDLDKSPGVSPLLCATQAEGKFVAPLAFFDKPEVHRHHSFAVDTQPLSDSSSESDHLGIGRSLYRSHDVAKTKSGEAASFPYIVSPIALFLGRNKMRPQSSCPDASNGTAATNPNEQSGKFHFSDCDDHEKSDGTVDVEPSTNHVSPLAPVPSENDELDSLDEGSSSEESEDSIDELLNSNPKVKHSGVVRLLRRWLRRLSLRRKKKNCNRMGVSPASYTVRESHVAQSPLAISGREMNISGTVFFPKLSPRDEPSCQSSCLSHQNGQRIPPTTVSQGTDESDAEFANDSSSDYSMNQDDDRVELLMPRFDATFVDETQTKGVSDPSSLENILRPWQVSFLSSAGITTCEELVEAKQSREEVLVKKMRRWRRKHRMRSFKRKQCALALHVWSRACSSPKFGLFCEGGEQIN